MTRWSLCHLGFALHLPPLRTSAAYISVLALNDDYSVPCIPVFASLAIAVADFACFRLRFTQGRCSLREGWKRCPLVDPSGAVMVVDAKPGGVFALSYRWERENASGFSGQNAAAVLRIARQRELSGGFVDALCRCVTVVPLLEL